MSHTPWVPRAQSLCEVQIPTLVSGSSAPASWAVETLPSLQCSAVTSVFWGLPVGEDVCSFRPFFQYLEPVLVLYTFSDKHIHVGLYIYCFDQYFSA